jgi:hypothetical protein
VTEDDGEVNDNDERSPPAAAPPPPAYVGSCCCWCLFALCFLISGSQDEEMMGVKSGVMARTSWW